jgi:hypothetical protein
MRFDRIRGDTQFICNFEIGFTKSQHQQHLAFARGYRVACIFHGYNDLKDLQCQSMQQMNRSLLKRISSERVKAPVDRQDGTTKPMAHILCPDSGEYRINSTNDLT